MLFNIANIGKIENASIELQGITVLAGNNSTGKSTFGKALYCIFNAFHNSEKEIKKERRNGIRRLIMRQFGYMRQFSELTDSILDKINATDAFQEIRKIICNTFGQNCNDFERKVRGAPVPDEFIDECVEGICDQGKITDDEFQKAILGKYLDAEFHGQVTHINSLQQPGTISLSFKDEKLRLTVQVDQNECTVREKQVDIIHRAFYVDTPFLMDDTNRRYLRRSPVRYGNIGYGHRDKLLHCLETRNSGYSISEEIIAGKKLESALAVIHSAVPGRFGKTKSGGLGFQEQGLSHPLEPGNISAGMKVFLTIKRLLETGEIKERDVLILDEPEIHLHPEWQIKFAEALVLLQKEFGLTLLLTTHSPYFLRAIEVYSEKQGTSNCCRYYLTTVQGDYCEAKDVTENTDGIYQILAKPFQTLRNIRYAE